MSKSVKDGAITIGDIGNYYGCLNVYFEDDNYYWFIENWNGLGEESIPKYLYDALIKFENERLQGK